MKYITNVNIIKKVFPCIFLFCKLLLSQLIKKNVTYYNNIYLFQFTILDLLLNAKVVNEIVKLNNNDKKKSSLCFIFWFIFNAIRYNMGEKSYIQWEKNILKPWFKKKIKLKKKIYKHPIPIGRGTDNQIIIYSKYIFQIVYFYYVLKSNKSKQQINTGNLALSISLAFGSLLFYGDYSKCCRGEKKNILSIPLHSVWHVLSALSFYFYDGHYLKSNVENV